MGDPTSSTPAAPAHTTNMSTSEYIQDLLVLCKDKCAVLVSRGNNPLREQPLGGTHYPYTRCTCSYNPYFHVGYIQDLLDLCKDKCALLVSRGEQPLGRPHYPYTRCTCSCKQHFHVGYIQDLLVLCKDKCAFLVSRGNKPLGNPTTPTTNAPDPRARKNKVLHVMYIHSFIHAS